PMSGRLHFGRSDRAGRAECFERAEAFGVRNKLASAQLLVDRIHFQPRPDVARFIQCNPTPGRSSFVDLSLKKWGYAMSWLAPAICVKFPQTRSADQIKHGLSKGKKKLHGSPPGIIDVYSAAAGADKNGKPYNQY